MKAEAKLSIRPRKEMVRKKGKKDVTRRACRVCLKYIIFA